MFLLEDHLIPSLYGTALQQQAVNLEKKIIRICALQKEYNLIRGSRVNWYNQIKSKTK